MKYMLMMNHPGQTSYQIFDWPKAAIEAHMAHMIALNNELRERGEMVSGEGLISPDQAKRVRAGGADGQPITDGIFAESKEFLAGFWIIDVKSPERAYEIAARASSAPGIDGKPLNMGIEVREVMSGPPPEML
jgi:hypothetical protein